MTDLLKAGDHLLLPHIFEAFIEQRNENDDLT